MPVFREPLKRKRCLIHILGGGSKNSTTSLVRAMGRLFRKVFRDPSGCLKAL